MVFSIFSKKKDQQITKSIDKYRKFLHENLSLGISVEYKNKKYYPDIETLEDRELEIRLIGDDRQTINYKIDQVVDVEFIDGKSGLYGTKIKITKKRLDEYSTYYKGVIVSVIDKIQRRGNYRLPVDLEISFVTELNKFRHHSGMIRDISLGGTRLESSQFIPKGRKLEMYFEIGKKQYKANGVVVATRYDDFRSMNIHHIKFEKLSHRQREELYDFVFAEQKRRIRSGNI